MNQTLIDRAKKVANSENLGIAVMKFCAICEEYKDLEGIAIMDFEETPTDDLFGLIVFTCETCDKMAESHPASEIFNRLAFYTKTGTCQIYKG